MCVWVYEFAWVHPAPSGCMYGGQEHTEGSSWFAGSTPCISCMCADGVTTCSEIRCLSPCTSVMNVPGECCPVCAGRRAVAAFCRIYLLKSKPELHFPPQTACLRAGCTAQVTVSTQLEIRVRSALVRFVAGLNLNAAKIKIK